MILTFEYEDLETGWRLEPVTFGPANLLVGPSGAGKTRILRALADARQAALFGLQGLPSARWRLEVEVGDANGSKTVYSWRAETEVSFSRSLSGARDRRAPESEFDSDARFVREEILRADAAVVERDGRFRFKGETLPRLDVKTSAVELLSSEDEIEPLYRCLQRIRFPRIEFQLVRGALGTLEAAEADRRRLGGDLGALRRETAMSVPWRLYILQRDHAQLFGRVVDDFRDIFPTVEELRVDTWEELGFKPRLEESYMASRLALGMKEEGVAGWIFHHDFSSGMEKTLNLLVEVALAPAGTVFLVDELENSLGVNCLPDVAELMLQGLDRIQFLATSHHPQVINGIPTRYWKVVTRRGSSVRVLDAESIPSLKTASPLEKFTQLLNLPEYEEGVA